MTLPVNPDHVADAQDKLFEQFKGSPKFLALLESYVHQVQLLDDAIVEVYNQYDIDGAEGAALDTIGRIVGEPRNNFEDERYRLNIKARIKINSSEGTLEDIVDLVSFVTGSASGITAGLPLGSSGGSFQLSVNQSLPSGLDIDRLFYYICQAAPAGVSFVTEVIDPATSYVWDVDQWDDATKNLAFAVEIDECLSPEEGFSVFGPDVTAPTVTIVEGAAPDINGDNFIDYTVTFSDAQLVTPVAFDASDVTVGGTATGGTVASVTGSNPFTVRVSGFTDVGTTNITVAAAVAEDVSGNLSASAVSADSTVTNTSSDFASFLASAMTINSYTLARRVGFSANEVDDIAGWDSVDGNATATRVGSGSSVVSSMPIDGLDGVVTATNTYFQDSSNASLLDLTATEGYIFEVIINTNTNSNEWILNAADSTAAEGVIFRKTAVLLNNLRDVSANTMQITPALTDGTWQYYAIGFDRTGAVRVYNGQNGVILDTTHTVTGAITNSGAALSLLGRSTSVEYNDNFAYCGFYVADNFDMGSSALFEALCDSRYTLLGQTPGAAIS